MRILLIHNRYQLAGGEDRVFQNEADLLEQHGQQVIRYEVHNDTVKELSRLQLVSNTLWNCGSVEAMSKIISERSIDVAHVHNTFPLISPSIYYALDRLRVPIVQTLHNYRLLCPSATMFRNGQPCEDCVSKAIAWPAAIHACYRDNILASSVTASMLALHRLLGTWSQRIGTYIALTHFARRKFIEGGMDPDRLIVKPNSLARDPGGDRSPGTFLLFVGRITEEKGLQVLLQACHALPESAPLPLLRIAGDGPLRPQLQRAYPNSQRVEWLGSVAPDTVTRLMRSAVSLVIPSIWYEGLPMTLVEAFAVGLPIVASELGSLSELVTQGVTGLKFRAGDFRDLYAKLAWLCTHGSAAQAMSESARSEFVRQYTPQRNYETLMHIYSTAIQPSAARSTKAAICVPAETL
jgi:glycosyltransferase involved in cell wall biosynthesis